MAHYEVEIKTLLGTDESADALRARMKERDASCICVSTNKQLNHYFEGGDIETLLEKTAGLFDTPAVEKFKKIVEFADDFSVRTRQKNEDVLLVVKASMDEGTSANTVSRLEFEETVPLSLSDLDQYVLDSGFRYQAKWSRAREEYSYKGATVCLDRNAGYGYVAEFEKIVNEEKEVEAARKELVSLMEELGVSELPQERLERMFAHYNANWSEYYGTERIFVIE